MEHVPCPACGSSEARHLFDGTDLLQGGPGSFSSVQCVACGSSYLASRPSRQEIGVYYPQDYMPHELARQANRRWLARLDYR